MKIKGDTKICAVIGDPVQHSLSPCMHNAAFEALNLNYAYVAFHVQDLKNAIAGMRGFNIKGLSVTIPHKVEIMQYLDFVTPLAKKIGAVNTVTNENGKLLGSNTDGYGALKAVETEESMDDKSVTILGVGGAARGIAFTIASERKPTRLTLVGRDLQKAKRLTLDIAPHTNVMIAAASFEELKDIFAHSDIIINTTPIGMHPKIDECIVPEEYISQHHLIFDTIYNPAKTLLLQRAENRFARTLNGIPMFVYQGAEQFHMWTGKIPPVNVMREAVEKALGYQS